MHATLTHLPCQILTHAHDTPRVMVCQGPAQGLPYPRMIRQFQPNLGESNDSKLQYYTVELNRVLYCR